MDEDLTGPTGDLLAGLALFRDAAVPAPSPELAALFAAVPTTTEASAPQTPRRAPVYKRIFAGIPAKVAAGALGALLAGTVGAGAMTGTISLTSSESDAPSVEAPAVDEAPVVVAGTDDAEHEDEVAVDEVDDDGANDAAADADLAAVPVPTSVDEAAQTHEFDEACGNHGAYVSHFAQTGTEPDCAVEARAAAAAAAAAADAPADATTAAADSVDTPDSKHEPKATSKGSSSGGNWQSTKAERGGKAAKSDKSKGGR